MKNVILHGDNQVESRKRLSFLISQARKRGLEIARVDGKTATKEDLTLLSRSQSLLAEEMLVVSENFFSGNKKAIEIADKLAVNNGTVFVFWEEKLLSPAILKKLPKDFEIEGFKIPNSVFKFLDSILPKNTKAMLHFYHQALKQSNPEFLLIMLARQLRLLIWTEGDPETLKLLEWQKSRLRNQAEKFNLDQLVKLHGKLLEFDRLNKRSGLPENLEASLELLLISI